MKFHRRSTPTIVLLQLLASSIAAAVNTTTSSSNSSDTTSYTYAPGMATTSPAPGVINVATDPDLDSLGNFKIPHIPYIFSYTIFPSDLSVKVGDAYALTCQTDSKKGLDELSWKVRTDQDNYRTLDCAGDNEGGFKCEITEFSLGVFSVLNVTTFERKGSHSSIEYNFICTAKPGFKSIRYQEIPEDKAVVTVYPPDHSLETGLEVVGGTLLVLVVLVMVWVMVRKGKFRSAFAGIQRDL